MPAAVVVLSFQVRRKDSTSQPNHERHIYHEHWWSCCMTGKAKKWKSWIRLNCEGISDSGDQRCRAHRRETRTKGSEGWLTKLGVSKWKSLMSAVDVCQCLRLQALHGLSGLDGLYLFGTPTLYDLSPFAALPSISKLLFFSPHDMFPINVFSSLPPPLCFPHPPLLFA